MTDRASGFGPSIQTMSGPMTSSRAGPIMAGRRGLLQPRRGQGHHRGMAALLQHRATTLIARIQTAGARGHRLAFKASRIAPASSASNGRKAHHALRLKADHLIGAGQRQPRHDTGEGVTASAPPKMEFVARAHVPENSALILFSYGERDGTRTHDPMIKSRAEGRP